MLGTVGGAAAEGPTTNDDVILQYIGHASFLLTTPDGVRVIMDPFRQPGSFPTDLSADVVTVSHFHTDHDGDKFVEGDPEVLYTFKADAEVETQTFDDVSITGYGSSHFATSKSPNTIFVYEIGSIKVVHLGGFGGFLEDSADVTLEAIADADVVIVPVGDNGYTLALEEIMPFMEQINAHTVVPCHFSVDADHRYYGLATLEEFLDVVPDDVERIETDQLIIEADMPFQIAIMSSWEVED